MENTRRRFRFLFGANILFVANFAGVALTYFEFLFFYYGGGFLLHFASREAEVTYLDLTVVVYQNITWFQISVHDARWVNEIYSVQNIVHYNDDVIQTNVEGVKVHHQAGQVLVSELHHNEEPIRHLYRWRVLACYNDV